MLQVDRFLIALIVIVFLSCSSTQVQQNSIVLEANNSIAAQAHFYTGLCEEEQKNWWSAAEHFHKAANMDPNAYRIRIHLGNCLLQLKNYSRGLAELEIAEKLVVENDYVAWFDLGQTYESAEMYSKAILSYQKSTLIFPKFSKGLQALANLQKQN